jgi:general secretion pathway protein D
MIKINNPSSNRVGKSLCATLTVVSLMLSMSIAPSTARAQFDDFGGGADFNPPPPPPPTESDFAPPPPPSQFPSSSSGQGSGFGSDSGSNFGTPPSARGAGRNGDAAGGILGGKQKERFAKSNIEDITNQNFPETIESFDFPNADIQDIVKAISELTGKNFIIDQGVRGKITIIAPSKLTVAEAYKAFLSALAINGYAIVPSGSFLKIRSARNAQRDSIETYSGAYFPNSDQMITRIIHLKHISADLVNRDLRILTSKDGEMSIYAPTNSIIISDYGANIERVMKIINQLDVPGFEDQLEVVPVKYAKAKDIAELIDKIVNKGDKNTNNRAGSFSAGVPRFSRSTSSGGQGSAYYIVFPDDRTNSLIVSGNKAGIERIRKLLKQLDFRISPEAQGGVNVYYVKYGEAEKIAQTMQGIAKDSGPKPSAGGGAGGPINVSPTQGVQTTQEIFGGDVKITADKGTNSLVIVASKQDYEVVLNLLSKIDIARDQVFVEAVIMEMKVTDAMDYNIGYFKFDGSGTGAKTGFNGLQSSGANSLTNLIQPNGGAGAILGFGSGETVQIKGQNGTTTTVNSLLGFLTFLKKNAQANILSTPQILAMDNQEATIEVGDKVITGGTVTTSTTGSQTSPIFEDATIKLKIKPFISPASNTIRMELDQSVKQLSTANTPKGFQDTAQPLATRNIKTNIVVHNGDTAVLGGLMKEDEFEDITKVPLLGDIPIIGWLFKSRSTSKQKTNMTIFLTPKIIRSAEDQKELLGTRMDQRLKYIKSIGGRDPFGEKADELQKRTATTKGDGAQ